MVTNLPTRPPDEVPPAAVGPHRRRARAVTAWAVAFVVGLLFIGLPTDPLYAFFWLWALTIAWRPHLPWRQHVAFARDWLPVVVPLAIYNLSRGFADDGATPHVTELINADVAMFGWLTDGTVPTVWLQRHLYDPDSVRWYDVLASCVYF